MEMSCEESVEGLALSRVLAVVLERLVSANHVAARVEPQQITKFHAMKAPGIGIRPYLERYVFLPSLGIRFVGVRISYVALLVPQNTQIRLLFQ